jgi:hypothetical protein
VLWFGSDTYKCQQPATKSPIRARKTGLKSESGNRLAERLHKPEQDPDCERKKGQLRARLERERTAPTQTVLPSPRFNSAPRVRFVIPDPEDVRPAREIPAKEIEEVNSRFWLRDSLGADYQLEETFELGFKLRCWHDLFGSESDWLKWRDAHLTIPADEVSLCMLLWDHNEQIKNGLARK